MAARTRPTARPSRNHSSCSDRFPTSRCCPLESSRPLCYLLSRLARQDSVTRLELAQKVLRIDSQALDPGHRRNHGATCRRWRHLRHRGNSERRGIRRKHDCRSDRNGDPASRDRLLARTARRRRNSSGALCGVTQNGPSVSRCPLSGYTGRHATHPISPKGGTRMAVDRRRGRGGIGGISLGGILVIIGIVVAIVWSLLLGIIIALIGLIAFGGFARGKWY